jgi:hypothetical protein
MDMESLQFLNFSTVSHTGAGNEVRKRSLISSTASEPAFRRIYSPYRPCFDFWHAVLTSPRGQIHEKTRNLPPDIKSWLAKTRCQVPTRRVTLSVSRKDRNGTKEAIPTVVCMAFVFLLCLIMTHGWRAQYPSDEANGVGHSRALQDRARPGQAQHHQGRGDGPRRRSVRHRGADLLLGCGEVLGSFGGNCHYSCYLCVSLI